MRWEDRHQALNEKTPGFGSQPIVFTGSPVEKWGAVHKWTRSYLSSYNEPKLQRVTDLVSPAASRSIPPYVYPNLRRPLAKAPGGAMFEELMLSRGQHRVAGGLPMSEFFETRCNSSKTGTTTVVQGWRVIWRWVEILAHPRSGCE